MKNQVFAGNQPAVALPVPSGIKSGDPVIVGGMIGVAATDRAAVTNGVATGGVSLPVGYASVEVDGVYAVSVAGGAIAAAGGRVYINPADNTLTATSASGLVLFGTTVPVIERGVASGATKASGTAVVNVKTRRPDPAHRLTV
ncbi:DUF2190 family protein [Nocardioides sp. W3-2-3]|uniref:capsid cement protein n=1 Tax=Nocardioides convexus TaxID=2712224 RepID=UPI002418769B|nr:capsid cement protein [Nocardioides convexus]NGZ99629.1 DUF2190 family protein [Nocardioides convexus]